MQIDPNRANSANQMPDMIETRSTVADGMRIDWDVPIPMDDGIVLRADVFRPLDARAAIR